MSTTDSNQQQGIPAPKFDLASMEREINAMIECGVQDLEFELRKERIVPYIIDITKPYEEAEPMISIDGSGICSAGNISAIVGEAKSKKTFLTTAIVASAFAYRFKSSPAFSNVSNNMGITVLWLDTEQSEGHVRKVIDRINTISGIKRTGDKTDVRLNVLALRELEPRQRKDVFLDALYTLRPNLVVIDGIADLLYDTNDLRESEAIVGELMALSTGYNCHIMCILHTNPGTDKARGHLGSALQRKAETVIYVHKVDDVSVVEPQFCRNEPFEQFAFRVNSDGIPCLCDMPAKSSSNSGDIVNILNTYFSGSVERKVLINKLVELRGVSADTARVRIVRAIKDGSIIQQGKIVQSSAANSLATDMAIQAPAPTSYSQAEIPDFNSPRNFVDLEDEVPF